jgi:drug/metabolite transporter (DMT)-like permease
MRNNVIKSHISALLMITAWGISFINTRYLLNNQLSPIEIYIYRFTLAYIGLLFFSKFKVKIFPFKDELLLLACGLTGGSIYFITENSALKLTLVSDVAIIVSTAPLLTSILVSAFYKDERFTSQILIGSFIALCGVALLTFHNGLVWGKSMLGDILAFCAALSWAFYSVLLKKLNSRYSTMEITRKTFFYGLITALVCLPFKENIQPFSKLLEVQVYGNLLFLGLICSMAAFFIWGKVIKAIGAIKASNYMYLGTIISVISAVVWFDEKLNAICYLGCALILIGVFLVENYHNIHRFIIAHT